MKTYWFGCNANSTIGLGHLSRLVAIAEELSIRGDITCFSHLSKLDASGIDLLSRSEFSQECICLGKSDFVIVDSYDMEYINYCFLISNSKSVLLVDETSPLVVADYYIQASPIKSWFAKNKLAPIFNFNNNPILRRCFDRVEFDTESVEKENILISLGSVLHKEEILQIILEVLMRYKAQIGVVGLIGFKKEIRYAQKEEFSNINFNIYEQAVDYSQLFPFFTLGITASGVTAWEMISLGVPGFVIADSENQSYQLEYLNKNKLRLGIDFRKASDFIGELDELFKYLFQGHKSEVALLENGRIAVVDWLKNFS